MTLPISTVGETANTDVFIFEIDEGDPQGCGSVHLLIWTPSKLMEISHQVDHSHRDTHTQTSDVTFQRHSTVSGVGCDSIGQTLYPPVGPLGSPVVSFHSYNILTCVERPVFSKLEVLTGNKIGNASGLLCSVHVASCWIHIGRLQVSSTCNAKKHSTQHKHLVCSS